MAREKSPAFQYYPKDLMSDDRVIAMSAEAFGVYWWLVSICWLRADLPDDEAACAALCRGKVSTKRFSALWPEVRACFQVVGDGTLRHKRLDSERGSQDDWREQSRKGGIASAESRRQSRGSANPRTNREPSGSQAVHNAHEPNVNTASASASASPDVHTHSARVAPLGARREHAAHALCGRVCLPGFILREFLNAKGGDEEQARVYVDTWATAQIRAIAPGGPREAEVIGDPLKWWRYQWEASHPTAKARTAGPAEPTQAEKDAAFLAEGARRQRIKDTLEGRAR